jgi:hypothetical protein
MEAQTSAAVAGRPGFFARFFGALKHRFRRIFGKGDAPNIYPFF